MSNLRPPRDNIVRAMLPGPELRDTIDGLGTMAGHFAVFNQWARIDSVVEGRFMERIAPGAFRKTFAENRDRIKVLFQHGKDPQIGDKPLGPISVLEEDETGARYEVPLLDTSYNRDLVPALRAGLLGASFRFSVMKDEIVQKPARSADNPEGLPERTIREAAVPEFGPVTFPAYIGATAGMRSMTDAYLRAITSDALPEGAEPAHSDAGSREPEPPDAVPVTPPEPERNALVTEYVTPEDRASRIKELKDEQARLGVEYPGALPEDVQARWDASVKEQQDLERDAAAWEARQTRIRANAEDTGMVEPAAPTYQPIASFARKTEADIYDLSAIDRAGSQEQRDQALRDGAMRALERATFPHPKAHQDEARDHVAQLVEFSDSPDKELARRMLTTGSPIYRRAFNKYVAGTPWSPEEQRAAALTTGGTTTGGYATPWVLDPTIIPIGAWTSINPYRAACRVVQLVGTNKWEALTATAVTAVYATEALAAVEAGPTFGQPTYECLRAQTFVTASIEMFQDRPDISAEIAVLIQEGKDTLEENKFSVGAAGGAVPYGMFTASAYTAIETIGNNVIAAGDYLAIEAGLPLRHRMNAAWFMSRAGIRNAQALETTIGQLFNRPFTTGVGNPNTNNTGNTGLQLLGYPVWEAPSAPSATTSALLVAWLGDPRSYIIVDRVGLNIEIVPHIFGAAQGNLPTGQRGIYAMWRNMAKPVNDDAGRTLKMNAP